jgi:hypothetical protein
MLVELQQYLSDSDKARTNAACEQRGRPAQSTEPAINGVRSKRLFNAS